VEMEGLIKAASDLGCLVLSCHSRPFLLCQRPHCRLVGDDKRGWRMEARVAKAHSYMDEVGNLSLVGPVWLSAQDLSGLGRVLVPSHCCCYS
jgi:hypothetical protein